MASLRSEIESRLPEDWRHPLAERTTWRDPRTTILIAGAVVLGVGLFTWYYLGPDLRRYMKIHSM
jgi:hypothetical protein